MEEMKKKVKLTLYFWGEAKLEYNCLYKNYMLE